MGEVLIQNGAKFLHLLQKRLASAWEIAIPASNYGEFLLSGVKIALCAMHGFHFGSGSVAKTGDSGAEEGLLSFFKLAGALAEGGFEFDPALILQPEARASDFLAYFLQRRAGFADVNEEAGAEGFDGLDGFDLGLCGHGRGVSVG